MTFTLAKFDTSIMSKEKNTQFANFQERWFVKCISFSLFCEKKCEGGTYQEDKQLEHHTIPLVSIQTWA